MHGNTKPSDELHQQLRSQLIEPNRIHKATLTIGKLLGLGSCAHNEPTANFATSAHYATHCRHTENVKHHGRKHATTGRS